MLNLVQKVFATLFSMRDAKGTLGKSWVRSKTLWVNILAVIAIVVSKYLGVEVPEDVTVGALAVINFILRLITSEAVGFIDNGGS